MGAHSCTILAKPATAGAIPRSTSGRAKECSRPTRTCCVAFQAPCPRRRPPPPAAAARPAARRRRRRRPPPAGEWHPRTPPPASPPARHWGEGHTQQVRSWSHAAGEHAASTPVSCTMERAHRQGCMGHCHARCKRAYYRLPPEPHASRTCHSGRWNSSSIVEPAWAAARNSSSSGSASEAPRSGANLRGAGQRRSM